MSRKTFFILLLSIHLIPFSAFGSDVVRVKAPETKAAELDDLSYSELEATFTDFKVIHKGGEVENNFNTEAYLSGTVFQKCWNKFEITNSSNDEEIRGAGIIGFRIRDLGGGRDCQKELRGARPRTKCIKDDPELNCVRLSKVEEARMNLANMGDGEIKIVRTDPNGDETRVLSEAAPVPAHVSKATVTKLKKDKQEAARAAEIKKYQHCVDTCYGEKAMESLNRLVELGVEVDFEAAAQKIALRDLSDLEKQAGKVKPEELQELREKLVAWNDEHPGNTDRVAKIYRQLAVNSIPKTGAKPSDYELASQIVREAQGLDGISKKWAEVVFQNDQRNISVGRMQAIAMDGVQNNMVFWPNYMKLMQELQTETMQACQGQTANMEGCSSSMQTLRSVSSIPQTASQVDQSRWQMQQQMQQQMQMAMNPGVMGGGLGGGAGVPQGPAGPSTFTNSAMPNQSMAPGLNPMLGNASMPSSFQNSSSSGLVWGGGQFGQTMSMTPPSFGR
ncbi:MAG: hypothetical protein A2X94_09715 [Bdellovibrionales bacterium GWB1_55_8]|nr:MAG: hypothetical protein A2X94_09715 [Bdellovibrionales bacterium GWB1_55_8]